MYNHRMVIAVTTKPGAKKEFVKQLDKGHFEVAVSESPVKGRANAAIIKALAKHFSAPPSSVSIVGGFVSRLKKVKIYV